MRKKLIATLLMIAAITTAYGAGPAQASDPPGRPTGVSAEVQWGQVVIEWDSPADPGVTHHRVYRQTEEQEETLAGETDSPETTSFTDPGAERGKTHAYRVERGLPRGRVGEIRPSKCHATARAHRNDGKRGPIRRSGAGEPKEQTHHQVTTPSPSGSTILRRKVRTFTSGRRP